MTDNPEDTSMMIDTQHHILPDEMLLGMPRGFVTNVGEFKAATQALKASGAFLTEQLGRTAR